MSSSPGPDDLAVALGSDLVVLAARLVRVVRRTHHLPPGLRVLSLLDELGPQGVGALAEADQCSQPTMTAAVRRLAEVGWVVKEPHPTDARSTVVTLTDAGATELRDVRRRSGEAVSARSTRTPEELATAVAVLADLLGPLPTPAEPAAPPAAPEGRTS